MMKKLLWAVAALLVIFIATAAIAVNYQRPVRTISAEDDSGTLLVYYRLPTRLVVLDPPGGRLLQQLGVGGRVVGVSAEAAADFPQSEQLGPLAEVRATAIVALRPQLVVLGRESRQLAAVLRQSGVNVWLTDPASLEAMLSGFTRLGKLVGREEQGSALASQLNEQLSSLQDKNPQPSKRVLFWLDQLFTAAGAGTLEADLCTLVGGTNAVATEGYVPLPAAEASWLLPQVVFAPEALLGQIGQLATAPPPASAGQTTEVTLPRLVAIPADFFPLNWENILARADWLQRQLLTPGS